MKQRTNLKFVLFILITMFVNILFIYNYKHKEYINNCKKIEKTNNHYHFKDNYSIKMFLKNFAIVNKKHTSKKSLFNFNI